MPTDLSIRTRLLMDASNYVRGAVQATMATKALLSQIDKTNDRTAWLAQGLLAIGPALAPIGAAGVPVLTGLATQMGLTAMAAGVAATAFNGVGDALGAINDYELEPTADNLVKMQQALEDVGPAGQEFVLYLNSIGDELRTLQDTAKEGMLPGVREGIESLMTMLPQVRDIIGDVAQGMGQLAAEGGAGLSGEGFSEFFDYLDSQARPLLIDMGRTMGNFIEGLAQMMVAFAPLTDRFSEGFLQMSRDFSDWAAGLETNSSFQAFIQYINDSIPMVTDFIGELVDAFVQLAQAAAPVGDVMLPVLTELLHVFSQIVDTPLGSVFLGLAAAMSIYGRAAALASITTGGMLGSLTGGAKAMLDQSKAALAAAPSLNQWGTALNRAGQSAQFQSEATKAANASVRAFAKGMAPAAAAMGLVAFAATDLDNKIGLSNTAMLAAAGIMVGGPWGAAIGATAGFVMDAAAANDELVASYKRLDAAITQVNFSTAAAELENARKATEDMREAIEAGASWTGGFDNMGNELVYIKDLFTDMGDEAKQAEMDASYAFRNMEHNANLLADALSPDDGNPRFLDMTLQQLDDFARRAAPAAESAGLDLAEVLTTGVGLPELEDAIRSYNREQDSFAGRTREVGDAVAGLDDDLLSTAEAANVLNDALDALLGPALNAEEATDAFRSGLREMREELEKGIKTFSGYTENALGNREATRARAEEIASMLSAQAAAGASAEELARRLGRAREAFIEEGIAAGFSREQMEARAREIGLTPKLVRTIFREAGLDSITDRAKILKRTYELTPKQVRTLISQINMGRSQADIKSLLKSYGLTPKQIRTAVELLGVDAAERALGYLSRDRTAVVYVRPQGGRIPVNLDAEANGGIRRNGARAFADGGYGIDGRYYARVPQIVKGGANVLWGELETGEEAYVSRKPGMEARNVQILAEAASWFGYGLAAKFADGGVVNRDARPMPAVSGGSRQVVVERIVERMPDRLVVDIGGETFSARVQREAGGEINADASFRGTLGRMGAR